MLVKFLVDCVYPQNDESKSRTHKAGDVEDLPTDYANRWIRRQVAEEVSPDEMPRRNAAKPIDAKAKSATATAASDSAAPPIRK